MKTFAIGCLVLLGILSALFALSLLSRACDDIGNPRVVADSGVSKASASAETGSDGLTIEQRNVRDRLAEDNKPGAIKHLYVISAYSGQVLIYSTVRGKVTSSGKRLSPSTYKSSDYQRGAVALETLGDDGTYGPSVEYIYWWDTKGIYHQHYVSGGQIVTVSSEPLAVKNVVINMALGPEK